MRIAATLPARSYAHQRNGLRLPYGYLAELEATAWAGLTSVSVGQPLVDPDLLHEP